MVCGHIISDQHVRIPQLRGFARNTYHRTLVHYISVYYVDVPNTNKEPIHRLAESGCENGECATATRSHLFFIIFFQMMHVFLEQKVARHRTHSHTLR